MAPRGVGLYSILRQVMVWDRCSQSTKALQNSMYINKPLLVLECMFRRLAYVRFLTLSPSRLYEARQLVI